MLIGAAAALIATICFALGNALEKRGVDALATFDLRHPIGVLQGIVSSPWWMSGAAISALGLASQIGAYSKLSISIVQTIGVFGIVLLVGISRLTLGEHLAR